jgi:hypothetical protein
MTTRKASIIFDPDLSGDLDSFLNKDSSSDLDEKPKPKKKFDLKEILSSDDSPQEDEEDQRSPHSASSTLATYEKVNNG